MDKTSRLFVKAWGDSGVLHFFWLLNWDSWPGNADIDSLMTLVLLPWFGEWRFSGEEVGCWFGCLAFFLRNGDGEVKFIKNGSNGDETTNTR